MTTFTASEVRATAHKWQNWSVGEMLHAYADRLEADEKAMPVAWRSVSLPTTFICDAPKNLDYEKWEPLYTHPAPADAERLVEALRKIAREPTKPWPDPHAHSREVYARAIHATYCAMSRIARDALATYSAQAQPPAASVPIPCKCYTEQDRKYCIHKADGGECWRAGALAAQENPNG